MAKAIKEVETQTETIQRIIKEGRKVVIKKEEENIFIKIRFNNEDTDGSERWRLLVNGNELKASEIIINCFTKTFSENFVDIGIKHHIVCEAKEVVFKDNIATVN